MNPLWFLRMSKWARNSPSAKRVKLVITAIALCLILVAIEKFIGWPDWLTVNRLPRH